MSFDGLCFWYPRSCSEISVKGAKVWKLEGKRWFCVARVWQEYENMTRVCQSMKIGGKEMVLCDKRAGYAGSGEAHRWSTVVTRDIWLARLSPSLAATFGYISILCAHPSSTNPIQYTTLLLHFASCSCLLLICQVVINTILTVGRWLSNWDILFIFWMAQFVL